ncbi:MAG: alpha/beta fold hydrolase [Chitinispirillaceae bacterium]|nr:alpha/beta fold hydrolase [Chitinispirillaceae bacterium]
MFSVPWEDRFFLINGTRVRYWEVGATGEAILFIHGLGGSIEQWAANAAALSRMHRVYCLDMPGCGKSDPPTGNNYPLESLSRFLDLFTEAKELHSFSLVGLSMGGAICLRYALDYPHKVRRLVLAGSAALGRRMAPVFRVLTLPLMGGFICLLSRGRFSAFVRSMVFDPSIISEDIIDFYYPLIKSRSTRRAFLRTLNANCTIFGLRKEVRQKVIERLGDLKQQTLIIWGRQDRHMPVANVHEALHKISGAKLVFFDQCAHNPQFEKAEEFNRAVEEFIGN